MSEPTKVINYSAVRRVLRAANYECSDDYLTALNARVVFEIGKHMRRSRRLSAGNVSEPRKDELPVEDKPPEPREDPRG